MGGFRFLPRILKPLVALVVHRPFRVRRNPRGRRLALDRDIETERRAFPADGHSAPPRRAHEFA